MILFLINILINKLFKLNKAFKICFIKIDLIRKNKIIVLHLLATIPK